jgi:hypothetical protein
MSDFQVPTHEIITPLDGVKVVLKDFISGYDDEAIEAIYTRGQHKITPRDPSNPEAGAAQDMVIDGSAIQDAEREGVKRVVLSVNGQTGTPEEILDMVYNLRKEDTKFVKKQVDLVINPVESSEPKKKNG